MSEPEPEPPPPPPPPPPRRTSGRRAAEREIERYAGDRKLNRSPLKATYGSTGSGLDHTLADIVARQRFLDGRDRDADEAPQWGERGETERGGAQRAPARREAFRPSPPPAQNLSGLEEHLRNITQRIEALQRPSPMEDVVPVLRQELSEISRSMAEAMPRRAIEAIETEVRHLAERLDHNRDSGGDGSTLANIEHGLADVRNALHSLTPAESLVGFQTAIQGLARKVDTIAASHNDPAVLEQLEAAITGLRSIVAHVASDDALGRLTEEVRGLAAKIERTAVSGPAPDMLNNLERRVGAIAQAMEESNARGRQMPAQVETVVRGLTDKIDRLQLSRGDTIAFGQLEDRITKLVEKLDTSGTRLNHLETIERGLSDVLVHLEDQRRRGGMPTVDTLKQDIESVNSTLSRVVDRLANIETGIRSGRSVPTAASAPPAAAPLPPAPQLTKPTAVAPLPPARPAPPPPEPPRSPATVTTLPTPPAKPVAPLSERLAAAAQAQTVRSPPPPREYQPIDPNLPPDHPLEPGSARTRGAQSPADRIAASEAALGAAKPPVIPDPAGKSNFIAAARRAAQAAANTPELEDKPADASAAPTRTSLRQRLSGKIRSMLVGASVVVLSLGAFRVALLLVDTSTPDATVPKIAAAPAKPKPQKFSAHAPESQPVASIARDTSPPMTTASTPVPSAPAQAADKSAAASSRQVSPDKPQNDVTGSIPSSSSTPPAAKASPNPAGESDGLVAAATAGNAAAAYLLAERHIDGKGARQSYEDAAHWLERAAHHGLAPAQFRLGTLYEKGLGVKKDLSAARKLYTAAADKGNAKAMHNLAVLYAEGIDGKPDYTTAAKWFRKAADRGIADSQYNLGVLCARGIGVEQNLAESYKWFALAAQQGDKDSSKKRDDVAAKLDAEQLMAAKLAMKTWTAQPQPAEATTVQAPPGGWDRPKQTQTITPTVKRRPRIHAPLQLGPG
jgi:localization factor PodJL